MNAALELAERARREGFADRPAFHTPGRTWLHSEVHDLAMRAAASLAARGVGRGDRLMLLVDDGIGLVASFLGAARLGAVTVLANPGLTVDDHHYLVGDSAARLVVTDRPLPRLDARTQAIHPDELFTSGNLGDARPAEVNSDAPLYVQYTSGTTGRPKGAVHRHRDLLTYHQLIGAPVLGIGPEDVLLSVSKLYFAYGFGNGLAFPLAAGCSTVLFPHRPTPEEVAEAVEARNVTLLFSVPSFYSRLPTAARAANPWRTLRGAVTAGEAVPRDLLDRTSELLDAPLWDQIGSTEAGHAFCSNGVTCNAPGTLGTAVPGFELEIRASDGSRVPDGAVGELWVRGPTVMAGYLDAPETSAKILVDGWLNTRDRALRRPDGTVEYHGRTDSIEVVGGINVDPAEIEAVLRRHPAVQEAAVVATTDATGRSSLIAFVVPTPGALRPAPDALEKELQALAREQLAPFKMPRRVRLSNALPRTPSGKLQRFKLRQLREDVTP